MFFFLMIRRHPRSTRTDTLFPYTTLFRSSLGDLSGLCLNRRLVFVVAKVGNAALRALGFARDTDVAPMQDQPVVGILHIVFGHDFFQFSFHLQHVLAWRQPGTVGNPEYMGIDGYRGLAECGVQYDSSEERRVGKGCVSTFSSRWWAYN